MRWLLITFLLCPFLLPAQLPPQWEEIRSLYEEGKVYAGLKRADKELHRKEADRRFLVLRADGRNRIGDHWKASTDAREALQIVPVELKHEAALQLGIALAGLGVHDSARYWFEESARNSGNKEALLRLARMEIASGESIKAKEKLDRILASDPKHVKALLERGAAHMDLGDTTAAKKDLDLAVELAPRDPIAWNSRGFHLYARREMHQQAIEDYDRAIKLDPNYSFAFNNRGWSYFKLGDKDKAKKNIHLAGRKRPNNPFVHRNLGLISLAEGDTTAACAQFRKAASLKFEAMHGNEVDQLIAEHCGDVPIPEDQRPATTPPARSNAPRSNAPRSNAP
jgi:Flp pilus assembly protein TadD